MQPVVRALRLLTALAKHGELGLQELANELSLPPSTVHRLASVLEEERYVVRTPRGRKFLLGPAVRQLVYNTSSDHIRRVAEPTVVSLNRATGETVFLAELVGEEIVCFHIRPGTKPLRLFVRLGRALPLHASASARAILAQLDERELDPLLDTVDFTAYTPRTITDRRALVRHLDAVRDRGFDICDDEMEDHVWAVAAPLRDAAGPVAASITVIAPLTTVGEPARRSELQSAVLAAAEAISAELGAAEGSGDPTLPSR